MQKHFDPLAQTLPADERAESFVIASSLRFDQRLREAIAHIRPEHMMLERHRIIWQAVCEFYDSSGTVTWDQITAHFSTGAGASLRESVGGIGYLADLMTEVIPDVSIERHITNVLDTYARRALMFKCNDVLMRLVDRNEDRNAIAHDLQEAVQSCVATGMDTAGFKTFEDMIRECGGLEAFLSRGKADAISYPWPSLTHMTKGGMRPGQFIVIAGQSGKGKTALVLNVVMRAAYSGRGTPLLFSLEMPKEEIGERMLALASGVDSYRFGDLMPEERERIRLGRSILSEYQYLVDDQDAASMAAIKAKTKDMLARGPVSVVVIDTIQLIEGRKGVKESREQEIATITRAMKRMAMQLKVPVIGISQINDLEDGKEPTIKNLRDSRTIWHNANAVMFLHFTRPYDMRSGVATGDLDLILAKHRGGQEGRIKLTFHAPTGAFYEREGENG